MIKTIAIGLLYLLGCGLLHLQTAVDVYATECGLECQLYNDSVTLSPNVSSGLPNQTIGHSETSTILWNGTYYMYYRTFLSASGNTCSIPQGIAVAVSANGVDWSLPNQGRAISALQSIQDGQSCVNDNTKNSTWVYSPDVIVDNGKLLMVFEQRDHNGLTGANVHSIRYVISENALDWSNSTRLLNSNPVSGSWDHEIGTPDIEKYGQDYVLSFHGNNNISRKLTRGYVTFSQLMQDVPAQRTPMVFNDSSGNIPQWMNYGVGLADMTQKPDGTWYMVFEAFGGASPECSRSDTATVVSVAKSKDLVNWTVRSPILVGLGTSCGWDMPSWQTINGQLYIVTTDDPPQNKVVQWRVIDKSNTYQAASEYSGKISPNQYIAAGSNVHSKDGLSRLSMQWDGNLVLYRNSDNYVYWASNTQNTNTYYATMQHDGNFVLASRNGEIIGHTSTWGKPGSELIVNDGSVSIDTNSHPIWRRPAPSRGL